MNYIASTSIKRKTIGKINQQNTSELCTTRTSKLKEEAMPLITAFELTMSNDEKRSNCKGRKNYKYKLIANSKPLKQVGTQIPSISSLTETISQQTEPPSIPVAKIYAGCKFPMGENMQHSAPRLECSASSRITLEEKEQIELSQTDYYNSLRHAAEIHRQTRQHMQTYVKAGMPLYNINEELENTVRRLLYENDTIKAGLAFPPRLCLNNCVVNFVPNSADPTIFQTSDLLKIHFGTHIKGHIIDSAYTFSLNPKYDKMIEIVKEATNAGIKEAGIDVRLCDVSAAMLEVMSSCEVELNGNTYPLKILRKMHGGHLLGPYNLYAGKTINFKRNKNKVTTRMQANECYAIEVFGTTGKGILHEVSTNSFYMRTLDKHHIPLRQQSSKHLFGIINRYFGTLGFCKRWLDNVCIAKYQTALEDLCEKGLVKGYVPLYDKRNTYSTHFGHTIILRPFSKEVLSRGNDY